MTTPIANSLVSGILQRHVSTGHWHHSGTQHLHLLYVDVLSLHVGLAHIDYALHIHQRTDCGGGHTVLSSTSLGNNASLAHALGKQHLADGVVDFMCTGMVKVFALEVDFAAIALAEPFSQVERRGSPYVVAQ